MTRPVGEPTWSKAQGEQDFGIRQLFRRPKPLSGTPIEYFRATRYNNTVNSGTGTAVTIDWEWWEFCDEAIFSPRKTNGSPDPIPGTDLVRTVELDTDTYPGRYTFVFGCQVQSLVAPIQLLMHDGDDITSSPQGVIHGPSSYNDGGGVRVFNTNGDYILNLSRIYPPSDQFGGSSFTPQISFTVAHIGSASKLVFNLFMEIHYDPSVNMCPEGSS